MIYSYFYTFPWHAWVSGWTTFVVGRNVGGSGLVGRVLEVASITCWCSVVLNILHHFVCFLFTQTVFLQIGLDMLNMRAQARVIAATTACSNVCWLLTEETVEILSSRGWGDDQYRETCLKLHWKGQPLLPHNMVQAIVDSCFPAKHQVANSIWTSS